MNVNSLSAPQKAAALAALLLALRFYYKSKSKSRTVRGQGKGKGKGKSTQAGLVTDFDDVARKVDGYAHDEFDVVVVGGGTAGCVVAARLSEDPSIRVLLLEAGGSGKTLSPAVIPASYSQFWFTSHEWGLYTEGQSSTEGRKHYWPRAKLLGGCTNMNAMMFHYGAPTDFDEWAALQKNQPGAEGWASKELGKYFLKFEKYHPSVKFANVDASLRGAEGFVDIGHHGHFAQSTAKWIEACTNVGISRTHDLNTAKGTMGVDKIMTYISPNGKRATSEKAYLTPDVLARPNLKVATKAIVHRVLFDTSGDIPRAVGVEFADRSGAKYVVTALKEVVICAGAVHTPQILMLAGLGPAEHLNTVGVPVVKDLPGVGSHLKDHVVVDLNYLDKTQTSLNFLKPTTLKQRLQLTKAIFQYMLFHTGPLTTNIAEAAAFVHSHDPSLFPPQSFPPETLPEDTTSGEGAPDIEIFVTVTTYSEHGLGPNPVPEGGYGFATHAVCLRPQSTGTIRLRSANPADKPVIDPQYLSSVNDVKVLARGLRLLDRIAHTEPLASMIDPAGNDIPSLSHDLSKLSGSQLEAYIRKNAQTLYHPTCTARMAPLEDGGVVDPYLRVHGVKGLRVADASVFPEINAGHTTAPVYAVGEKAADMIKADIGSSVVKK